MAAKRRIKGGKNMKRNGRSKYNCLIYMSSEDNCWVAHSLHTDQIGTGDCPTEALADLIRGLKHLCELAAEHPDTEISRDAPAEIKRMIRYAKPLPDEIFQIAYRRVHDQWPEDWIVSSPPHQHRFKAEIETVLV